ncbi:MAG TPA: hypothetical protein VLU43_05910 [Anaeromyxobacteraceae bacterium]|nr:hypothetical protein [Anaeromyxobacteraceae bacterium]
MFRLARVALAALLLPALAVAAPPQKRGPSTPAERKRALEVTHRLERDPLGKGAGADRRWLFQWIVDIPDVNVTSCNGPLDALAEDEGGNHGKELYVQSVFGMAAYLIEHPKDKDDWVAVQKAGIESVLKAYRALKKVDEDIQWPVLDDLEAARKAGKLADVVRDEVNCKEGGEIPGDAI